MQTIIGDDQITTNEQLYGNASVDDAAMINADNSLTAEQKSAALMDPETYKFNRTNPHILRDAANYPAIFANLSAPSKYLITRTFQPELQKFEDEIKIQQRTMGPFEAMMKGYFFSRRSMRIGDLEAQRRDAIHDGDEAKVAELDKKLTHEKLELAQLEAPNRRYWGAAGSVGASVAREAPELILTGVATAALTAAAPETGGATAAGAAVTASRFAASIAKIKKAYSLYRTSKAGVAIAKVAPLARNITNAALIYNDTANIEGGSAYAEMRQKHPDWDEKEVYEKSVMIGRVIGALESTSAFLGTAVLGGRAATGIARKTFFRNATLKAVEEMAISADEKVFAKKAISNLIENGVIKPAMLNKRTFVSKMIDRITRLAKSRTAQTVEFGADIGAEGITEVYQNKITELIEEQAQGESIGYKDALVGGYDALSEDVGQIYNHIVNGAELSQSAKETMDTFVGVALGSALVGGGFKAMDVASNRVVRQEARSLGNQLDIANNTIKTFDTILAQKKNGELYGKSPETANEFYKNAVKGGEIPQDVYVDIDKLSKIIDEMKDDPVATAKVNALKLGEKIASGQDVDLVSIPSEDFIKVAVDPENDTFYQKIKGAITTNPALESKDGVMDMIRKIATEDPMFSEQIGNTDSVFNMVLKNQKDAGADEAHAAVSATIAQSIFNNLVLSRNDQANMQKVMEEVMLRIQNVEKIVEEGGKTYMQYAGVRALTANSPLLKEAIEMEKRGERADIILDKTGWFHDEKIDNWKFEISDNEAKINFDKLDALLDKKIKKLTLEDILEHEKLFKAYPFLRKVPVVFDARLAGDKRAKASLSFDRNTLEFLEDRTQIVVNRNKAGQKGLDKLRGTLFHEIQHVIQAKENFYRHEVAKGFSDVPKKVRDAAFKHQVLSQKLYNALSDNGIVDIYGYGGSRWSVRDALPYLDELAQKSKEVAEDLKEWRDLEKNLSPYYDKVKFENYLKLSHENEARDTAARLDYTEEERRQIPPAAMTGELAPMAVFARETPVSPEVEQIAGAITFGTETIIKLSKVSNPTTFAHEMFHLYGMTMLKYFNNGMLNERASKNVETLAEFAGFEKDENGKYILDGDKAREAHEKIAEAGTTYLKTGKAPAPYLKEIFDTIAEWFATVYRMLRMSEVPLDKKVTKVFDEIFVPYEKQQQILAERRFGFIPRPESMTVEQYEKYKAEKRAAAMRGTTEEVKKAAKLQEIMSNDVYKAEREASYNEAYEDLGELPVYQLIDDVLKYKINKGSLAKISQDIVLPKNYLSVKQGVDITQLLSEYSNVATTEDALAQILSETPSRESAANYLADKHMEQWLQEKYPELAEINSETAARNEKVFKLAVMEYMMLSGIGMERFNQIHNDLMATAEYMVQNMPLRKMANVQRWIEQESKLMQRYDYTNNPKEQANIKRQQAILNYYTMRSKQISAEAKRFNRKSKKYRGQQTKDILKKIDGETFDLLKSILGNFKLTNSKPNTTMPMSTRIDSWVNSMAQEGYTGAGEIERYRDKLVNGIEDKLTTKDFEFLREAFSFIEAVGKKQKEILVDGVSQNVEDAAQDILNEYIKNGTKPLEKELGSAVMREAVMRTLWPQNVFLKFVAPVFEGLTKKDLQIAEWREQASDIIKPMYKQMQNKVTIDGRVYTNENLLVMMLNSGNTHNINCMVKTLQFQLNDPTYSADDLFSALNQAPKELREMTRKIWKIFDDNKQRFQEAQRQIDGKVLKFVQPEAYEFEDGEQMPGGYYPAGKVSVIRNYDNAGTKFQNEGTYATKSFQMERTGAHGDLDLTLGSLNAWFYKMAGVINVAVPYNNMGKLLRNETFRRTVGPGMVKSVADWMNLSVTPDKVNQTLSAINQIASVSILGANPVKMFTQLSGVIPAMAEVGPFWIMQGIATTSPVRAIHEASKLSKYMYARYAHPEEHLHLYTTAKDMLGSQLVTMGKDGAAKLSNAAMSFIIYGDAIASSITWKAEFAKEKAAGYTDKQASDLADSKVRMLQGDASAGSRAPIIQGNMRFFTMFASYFIGLHSLVKAHGMKGNEKSKAIGLIFAAAVVAPMFEAIFKTAWKAATSDDDDKKKWKKEGIEDSFDLFLNESINNIASTAGAIWLPHFGLGGDLGSALVTGRTYAPENLQLKYMLKPIEVGANLLSAAGLYSEGNDKKASQKVKKSLQSLFEFSMLNPSVANKVSEIIIGD